MWWLVVAILILLALPGLWANFWIMTMALILLALVSLGNRLWIKRLPSRLRVARYMPEQAFNGDIIEVNIEVRNLGRLPAPWLSFYDNIPSGLSAEPRPEYLLALHGREKVKSTYQVTCKRRGRFLFGPLDGQVGGMLDTAHDYGGETLHWNLRTKLVVYPEIVPLERLQLPSRLPLGSVRTRQPLQPDPSRIAGVREYQPGDDPRHIDWRNTARLNQLLVKQFERTRYVPLAIFLDLRAPDMQYIWRQIAEASIVVAASLAKRASEMRQEFGLYSNGFDPGWQRGELVDPDLGRPEMPPRPGEAWLFEILDKLAGIELTTKAPPLEVITGRWTSTLPWGSTIVVVSFEPYPALVAEIGRLRRAGFTMISIFTAGNSKTVDSAPALEALRSMGSPVFDIVYPGELNLV